MQDFIIYFAKANITLFLLFLIYWLLLRHEKFFILNRIILLSIVLTTFFLPLLPLNNFSGAQNNGLKNLHERLSEVPLIKNLAVSDKQHLSADSRSNGSQHLQESSFSGSSFLQIGFAVYLLIAFIFFVRFVFQLLQLCRLLEGNETKTIDGIVYHTTMKCVPPFSFFQHMVINKSHFEVSQIEQIIAHEKVHIRQWHMIDILLSELLRIVFWINPFAWLLNQSVKLNLEYIADEKILSSGVDRKSYQLNILTTCLNPVELEMASLFTSSKIKLRIKMMNAQKSPLGHMSKYVLVLPIITVAYFIINPVKTQASTINYEQQADRSLNGDGTALILAVRHGNSEEVKALVDAGTDINFSSPGDGNPLITACIYGQEQIAFFLIDKGADINAMVEGDETPLINASRNGNLHIVQYLIAHGADLNLSVMANATTRPELRSPLSEAIRYKHLAVEAYLREKGAKQ